MKYLQISNSVSLPDRTIWRSNLIYSLIDNFNLTFEMNTEAYFYITRSLCINYTIFNNRLLNKPHNHMKSGHVFVPLLIFYTFFIEYKDDLYNFND